MVLRLSVLPRILDVFQAALDEQERNASTTTVEPTWHEPHRVLNGNVADEFRDHGTTACKRCGHSFSGDDTMVR